MYCNNLVYYENMKIVIFDVVCDDVCYGHANDKGAYHHHAWSSCLAEHLGDDGTGHSSDEALSTTT